jgi:TldD protein
MLNFKQFIKVLLIAGIVFCNLGAVKASDSLLVILQEELDREMESLEKEEEPPYFLSFRVDEINAIEVSASFGCLTAINEKKHRIFTPQVRIGDYSFDNTHEFKDDISNGYYGGGTGFSNLPLDNNKKAIQHAIWLAVDETYKSALEKYSSLINRKSEVKDDTIKDFSQEKTTKYYDPILPEDAIANNTDTWIAKLKDYSKRFSIDTSILTGQAYLKFYTVRKYYLSSEGTSIVQNYMLSQLQIMAIVRNKEGHILPQHFSIIGEHPNELLNDKAVLDNIDTMVDLLGKLKHAKPAEAYAGPAILSAEAAGVFFHEIFGHRVEGHRLERANDGQTFTDKVGKKVLPKDFSVVSDPTLENYGGKKLIGTYLFDDEGVKSERVQLVERGSLKNFLMSRKPTSKFSNSNGHSRAQPGSNPVSRQSNLIVTTSKTYSDKELRKKLISECKKQNKEYGYYFKSVIGGFTVTDRFNPNVFNIMPSEVYRVYVDGRPDELVAGVELIGTPLTMFSNIICGGDKQGIFSGFCGAESGYVPVTAISPALFVRKIETQKGMEIKTDIPLLPSPTISGK